MSSYPEAIEIAAELERRYGSDPLDPAADPQPCIELSAARLLRVLYNQSENLQFYLRSVQYQNELLQNHSAGINDDCVEALKK